LIGRHLLEADFQQTNVRRIALLSKDRTIPESKEAIETLFILAFHFAAHFGLLTNNYPRFGVPMKVLNQRIMFHDGQLPRENINIINGIMQRLFRHQLVVVPKAWASGDPSSSSFFGVTIRPADEPEELGENLE